MRRGIQTASSGPVGTRQQGARYGQVVPTTAEWGLITAAGVGVAGIVGTLFSGVFQRSHDRKMARDERRAESYVSALRVMDAFQGAAGRNVVPDGSGYRDEGEPSRDELALNAAQMKAFGSPRAHDAFRAFESTMWAFYGRHSAADGAAARQLSAGVDDPLALLPDRQALANAVDQLRARVEDFGKIVREELRADEL